MFNPTKSLMNPLWIVSCEVHLMMTTGRHTPCVSISVNVWVEVTTRRSKDVM